MKQAIKHSQTIQQMSLGTVAYWSNVCAPMFGNNDRSTEIKKGPGDGWDG